MQAYYRDKESLMSWQSNLLTAKLNIVNFLLTTKLFTIWIENNFITYEMYKLKKINVTLKI